MTCMRKSEREAKKQRLLARKQKEPNLTVRDLVEIFGVPKRTVELWVAKSGLGQLRTEDKRRRQPPRVQPQVR